MDFVDLFSPNLPTAGSVLLHSHGGIGKQEAQVPGGSPRQVAEQADPPPLYSNALFDRYRIVGQRYPDIHLPVVGQE